MGIIYLMTNKINGLQYVGQTSLTLAARMRGHKNEAKTSKPDVYFVRALHKYGFENFEVEIIEECPDNLLDEKEIFWINEYDTFLGPGYNSTRGGKGNKKFLNSDILEMWEAGLTRLEIADKLQCHPDTVSNSLHSCDIPISEIMSRGQKTREERKKEVLQYDYNGNLLNIYSCAKDAGKAMGGSESNIRQACNHHVNSAYGYIWCHKDDIYSIEELLLKSKRNRPVNCYSLKGEFKKTYISCIQASKALNTTRSCIENAANGKALTCKKMLWQYYDDKTPIEIKVKAYNERKNYQKKKISQYYLKGNFIRSYNSAKEASLFINKEQGASSITKACRGKLKTAYGYKWSYAEA